ncbi:MAG: CDP-alcohol phosphatidyltransferase family protein [Actinomycetota bacterium]|nr:CDP-alcohol phosphatidyltransferase family protein [Actinomycetota bacterium]MDQ5813819.1 CDP-alcohol phosphatidyltransferase family protein [Actinomycetota bacterium]
MGLPHREPRRSFSYKEAFRRLIRPLARFLSAMRVRPDALTATGWAFSLCAAVLFAVGYTKTAGAVMLFAGLFDALDGAVARESGRMSTFGAFLDSTLDRFSEAAIFVGVIFFYAASQPYAALLAGVAMTFSLMTSYTRARAEGLGLDCEVGLLERAGRVMILSLFSLAGLLFAGLALVAAGALVTTAQRFLHVRRLTRG